MRSFGWIFSRSVIWNVPSFRNPINWAFQYLKNSLPYVYSCRPLTCFFRLSLLLAFLPSLPEFCPYMLLCMYPSIPNQRCRLNFRCDILRVGVS